MEQRDLFTVAPTISLPDNECGNRPLFTDEHFVLRYAKEDALPGHWPWMVNIQIRQGFYYMHQCGGTILNSGWVMTAKHCVSKKDEYFYPRDFRLVFGTNRQSNIGENAQVRRVAKWIFPENSGAMDLDIALIHLDKPIEYNDYIQPACLPDKNETISSMMQCYITGWGKLESGAMPDILQEVTVNMISPHTCQRVNKNDKSLGDQILCTSNRYGTAKTCKGDSGGPLMCKRETDKVYSVVGIISMAPKCALHIRLPSIYMSTQYFLDWMSDTMERELAAEAYARHTMKVAAFFFFLLIYIFIICKPMRYAFLATLESADSTIPEPMIVYKDDINLTITPQKDGDDNYLESEYLFSYEN
ncbi:chymotrypsin-like elastase family member 2A [Rhinophrynus dorsalis]